MERRLWPVSISFVVAVGSVSAQPRPAFEVVSIHQSAPFSAAAFRAGQQRSRVVIDAARVVLERQSLLQLICRAYSVEAFQVTGPNWLPTSQFDIFANLPVGVPQDNVPAMLQTMLQDRFGLTLHQESRVYHVYALVVGTAGLKLKRPSGYEPDSTGVGSPGPFDSILPLLTSALQRSVIDRTGLEGTYEIPLGDLLSSLNEIPAVQARMDPANHAISEANPPDSDTFQVLRKWGLQLDPLDLNLPSLIIDHVDKTPSEN
jgi:uncharacterized protein (TIGR03435 family)